MSRSVVQKRTYYYYSTAYGFYPVVKNYDPRDGDVLIWLRATAMISRFWLIVSWRARRHNAVNRWPHTRLIRVIDGTYILSRGPGVAIVPNGLRQRAQNITRRSENSVRFVGKPVYPFISQKCNIPMFLVTPIFHIAAHAKVKQLTRVKLDINMFKRCVFITTQKNQKGHNLSLTWVLCFAFVF